MKTTLRLTQAVVLTLLVGCGNTNEQPGDELGQLQAELRGPKCGAGRCPSSQVCCNDSCGICTEPGGFCVQQYCEPAPNTCTVIALCLPDYVWSSTKCRCIRNHNPGNKPGACSTDADCRVFSDYCTGCDCRALSSNEQDPTCSSPGVRCFADPCGGKVATCVNNACTVTDAPVVQ